MRNSNFGNADLNIRNVGEDTNRMELVQASEKEEVDLGGKEWYVGKAESRTKNTGVRIQKSEFRS